MDDNSYRLVAELSVWDNLLGPIVGWYSPSIGVRVNIFQDSSRVGIADDTVGFWIWYELVFPLGALIDSDIWLPIGLQFIAYIPPGSKFRYPDLVISPSQATHVVTPSGSCPNFLPPPSGTCLTFSLQAKNFCYTLWVITHSPLAVWE